MPHLQHTLLPEGVECGGTIGVVLQEFVAGDILEQSVVLQHLGGSGG